MPQSTHGDRQVQCGGGATAVGGRQAEHGCTRVLLSSGRSFDAEGHTSIRCGHGDDLCSDRRADRRSGDGRHGGRCDRGFGARRGVCCRGPARPAPCVVRGEWRALELVRWRTAGPPERRPSGPYRIHQVTTYRRIPLDYDKAHLGAIPCGPDLSKLRCLKTNAPKAAAPKTGQPGDGLQGPASVSIGRWPTKPACRHSTQEPTCCRFPTCTDGSVASWRASARSGWRAR